MADLKVPRLNRCIFSGRIGNEIELKYTPKGTPVVRLVVAVDRRYKDETEQWQTVTSWIDCVAWNKWAEFAANQVHKGSAVIIEGRIETRNWTDQNNQNRKAVEVIVDVMHTLEWRPREEGSAPVNEEVPFPTEEITPQHSPSTTTTDDVPF
mgnify:FL=1